MDYYNLVSEDKVLCDELFHYICGKYYKHIRGKIIYTTFKDNSEFYLKLYLPKCGSDFICIAPNNIIAAFMKTDIGRTVHEREEDIKRHIKYIHRKNLINNLW